MISRILLLLLLIAAFTAPGARASDDRVSFLHEIKVQQGEEIGDAVCFLCSVHNDGVIHGDAVAFGGNIAAHGNIQGDVVAFLGGADISPEVSVGGDCVVFGGTINRHGNGRVGGDQVAFPFVIFLIPVLFLVLIIWGIRALVLRSRSAYVMPPPSRP